MVEPTGPVSSATTLFGWWRECDPKWNTAKTMVNREVVWTLFTECCQPKLFLQPKIKATLWPVQTNHGDVVWFATCYNYTATDLYLRECLAPQLTQLLQDQYQELLEIVMRRIFAGWDSRNDDSDLVQDVRVTEGWQLLPNLLPWKVVQTAAALLFTQTQTEG